MYVQRKSLLDVFQFHDHHLGLFRESFDRVVELAGFELTPVEGVAEVWNFRGPRSGQRGRLIDVSGFLFEVPVALTTRGRAYMITRQDFTLALLLPGAPQRLKLTDIKYSVVQPRRRRPYPEQWPAELVTRVIRYRWHNIVILNEAYLLRQIGLRGAM